jgi:hypothetical protein
MPFPGSYGSGKGRPEPGHQAHRPWAPVRDVTTVVGAPAVYQTRCRE